MGQVVHSGKIMVMCITEKQIKEPSTLHVYTQLIIRITQVKVLLCSHFTNKKLRLGWVSNLTKVMYLAKLKF